MDERDAPLFEVFAKQWTEECRAAWKASTLSQYQQILKSQLSPAFSELRVSAITESRVRQLLTQLQDDGLSARRMNLTLLVLKMILRTAARRRLLRDDPTEHVRGLREPKPDVDPLDPDGLPRVVAPVLHRRLLDRRAPERTGRAPVG
jgi:site-specific recombinase XerC